MKRRSCSSSLTESQYLMRMIPERSSSRSNCRARPHELLVLLRRAEAHDALDAGAVVPAAVEQDHLPGGRQVGDVALEVPLRALALGRRAEGDDADDARVRPLDDPLDRAALAGRVAALEQHDDLQARVDDPRPAGARARPAGVRAPSRRRACPGAAGRRPGRRRPEAGAIRARRSSSRDATSSRWPSGERGRSTPACGHAPPPGRGRHPWSPAEAGADPGGSPAVWSRREQPADLAGDLEVLARGDDERARRRARAAPISASAVASALAACVERRRRGSRGRAAAAARTSGRVLADAAGEDERVEARRARRPSRRSPRAGGGRRRRRASRASASSRARTSRDVGVAGEAEQAALALQPAFERVGVDAVAQQPEHEARVDAARAGGHDEPLERREAHRRVDAAPVAHRGQRRAGAEVAASRPAAPRRAPRGVGVREAVEAVAPQRRSARATRAAARRSRRPPAAWRGRRCRSRRPRARRAGPARRPPARPAPRAGAAARARRARAGPRRRRRRRAPARRKRAPPCTTRWPTASGRGQLRERGLERRRRRPAPGRRLGLERRRRRRAAGA